MVRRSLVAWPLERRTRSQTTTLPDSYPLGRVFNAFINKVLATPSTVLTAIGFPAIITV